jgi:1-acyl-sn-glycerol-3-phosphate acyltransferase
MRFYYRLLRYFAQAFFVLYFRGRVFGLRNVPRTGPVLLACNHQSFFDPVSSTLALHREGNYMARDSLFLQPYFRRFIESLNAFPVKRGAADVGAVKEILRRLKAGRMVVVFPEATRTRDGRIGAINANSLLIAKKAGATIVPCVIDGAFEAWPRTAVVPRPVRMHVTYCESITARQVGEWSIDRIAEEVTRRLASALSESNQRRRRAGCAHSAAG